MALSWYGDFVTQKVTSGAVRGLTKAAAYVHSVTVPKTPIDKGDLRGSLQVTPASLSNPQASIHTNLPYAIPQHENLHYHHPRGGQAKFLELGLAESHRQISNIIAAEVRRG